MQPLSIVPNEPQQVVIASRPGWIYAWQCKCWLSVYKSPLVKDTSPFYEPVAQVLLSAAHIQVVHRQTVIDPDMMFGEADFMLIKLWRF